MMLQLFEQNGSAIALALSLPLPFMLVFASVRRNLDVRRQEIEQRLGLRLTPDPGVRAGGASGAVGSVFAKLSKLFPVPQFDSVAPPAGAQVASRYFEAYPGSNPARQFDRYYSLANYGAPLLLLSVTVMGLGFAIAARLGLADPFSLARLLGTLPHKTLAGAVGGYIWTLYDLVLRQRENDLPPGAFYRLWIRLPIAAVAAPALTPFVAGDFQLGFALFIGALPTTTLLRFATSKIPGLRESSVAEDPPSLQWVQGMSESMQERCGEERIERVQHLAYKDPIKLLIRCNVDWDTIIDFIDQALLVQHVSEKIVGCRPLAVRGAIDMAALYERYTKPETDADKAGATAVIERLAAVLGTDAQSVLHLGYVLWWDPVVAFLWSQWSSSRSGEGQPEGGRDETDAAPAVDKPV